MRKLILGGAALLALMLTFAPGRADALLSVSADLPLQYTFNDKDLGGAKSVSGIKLGLSLPFLLGLGYESYEVKDTDKVSSTDIKGAVNMFDLYVDLPIPIINVALGVGVGTAKTTVPASSSVTVSDATLTQYWASIGLPLFLIADIHVGYHVISGKGDVKSGGSKVDTLKYDGNMISLGVKVGF